VTPAKAKPASSAAAVFDPDEALAVYRLMSTARQFEEQLAAIFAAGKLAGWFHSCVGHEAVGSVFGTVLRADDHLVPYHRSRASLFAKGMTPLEVALELMGRAASPSAGRGGDGHVIHPARRVYGMTASLGAGIPIASGIAYGARLRGTDEVVLCDFGDGTSNRGAVQEGLNFAAIWDLPVVFVCENNLYGEFTPFRDVLRADNVSDRAAGLGMASAIVDGNDPEAVRPVLAEAVERARAGGGPTLIEAKTYRLRGHYEGDPQDYREKDEILAWSERDPVVSFARRLSEDGRAEAARLAAIDAEIAAELEATLAEALASPLPDPEAIVGGVYSEAVVP
jgi:acetoin:2,6-dichlorophenolindophenol oxidoreductase subunit alpha